MIFILKEDTSGSWPQINSITGVATDEDPECFVNRLIGVTLLIDRRKIETFSTEGNVTDWDKLVTGLAGIGKS